jgi:hypothetical protein
VITKLFVSGAIVLGAAVGLAAPAGADPDININNLTCSCRGPVAVTSRHVDDQIDQGLQDALDLPAAPGQQTPPR